MRSDRTSPRGITCRRAADSGDMSELEMLPRLGRVWQYMSSAPCDRHAVGAWRHTDGSVGVMGSGVHMVGR